MIHCNELMMPTWSPGDPLFCCNHSTDFDLFLSSLFMKLCNYSSSHKPTNNIFSNLMYCHFTFLRTVLAYDFSRRSPLVLLPAKHFRIVLIHTIIIVHPTKLFLPPIFFFAWNEPQKRMTYMQWGRILNYFCAWERSLSLSMLLPSFWRHFIILLA